MEINLYLQKNTARRKEGRKVSSSVGGQEGVKEMGK